MNINAEKSPRQCATCGMTKMQIEGNMACPNCTTTGDTKTGHTIVITEPNGKDGPVKIQRVDPGVAEYQKLHKELDAARDAVQQPGTISVNVPVQIFPEFVTWCRKLKLPKDWSRAAEMKMIVDFQAHINSKLEDLSK